MTLNSNKPLVNSLGVLVLVAVAGLAVGCVEERIDPNERVSAEKLATTALITPSNHKIHVSVPGTVPALLDGWCARDKLKLMHLLSSKRMHIFRVECGAVPPFEIRVDYKGATPLLYADPLATKSDPPKF